MIFQAFLRRACTPAWRRLTRITPSLALAPHRKMSDKYPVDLFHFDMASQNLKSLTTKQTTYEAWFTLATQALDSFDDNPYSFVDETFLSLKGRNDLEIKHLLWIAADLKERIKKWQEVIRPLEGKSVAMIFQKPSTRTRVSTETGVALLGGHPVFLTQDAIHLGVNESLEDTARTLSGYVDLILARVHSHDDLVTLTKNATVPVINGLSDMYHPLQTLADLLTLQEHYGYVEGLNITWVGDGNNNVTHSLMMAAPKMGINLNIATPKGYEPDQEVMRHCQEFAEEHGTVVNHTSDVKEACVGANVLATDTWVSAGKEDETERRFKAFNGYQINSELVKVASDDWTFLHCLPRRSHEVSDEIFHSDRSLVWNAAENRKWTVMAVLASLITDLEPEVPVPTWKL